MSQQVEAATEWASNAELIEACHTLGYLRDSDYVLDPTYGDGIWWNRWRPARLEANIHDNGGYDFRAMPYDDETFDAVAFDPPYVAPGGRETSTLNMHHRYGMRTTPATPRLLHEMNAAGLAECARVVKPATSREGPRPDEPDKPSGIILVKCQDYVWSQHLQMGTFWMIEAAHELGLEVADRLEHIGDVRAQPLTRRVCADRHCRYRRRKGEIRCGRCGETGHEDIPIRQVHARRNLSTMLVLRRSRWGDRTARAEAAGQAALNLDGDISAELDDVRPSPEYL